MCWRDDRSPCLTDLVALVAVLLDVRLVDTGNRLLLLGVAEDGDGLVTKLASTRDNVRGGPFSDGSSTTYLDLARRGSIQHLSSIMH